MSFGHHLLITTVTHLEKCGQYGLLLEESRTEGRPLTKFLASRKAGGWQAPLTHLAGTAGAPQHPPSWGSGQVARRKERVVSYLCLALMCICKPLRLEALCPHSSQTNSFSPRCLNASCKRSSVRDRKHLEQVEHCKSTGERRVRQLAHSSAPRPAPRPSQHHAGRARLIPLHRDPPCSHLVQQPQL